MWLEACLRGHYPHLPPSRSEGEMDKFDCGSLFSFFRSGNLSPFRRGRIPGNKSKRRKNNKRRNECVFFVKRRLCSDTFSLQIRRRAHPESVVVRARIFDTCHLNPDSKTRKIQGSSKRARPCEISTSIAFQSHASEGCYMREETDSECS